jgi:CDP-diacylglycerol--glycerol-3-phosphate 3-phosphatidyltransferase
MLRIPLTVLFIYFTNLFIVEQAAVAGNISLFISAMIILTDLLDGILARKYLAVTRFGQIFDVMCDFFYILFSLILFNYYEIISKYITCVVIYKFIEFIIFSMLYDDPIPKKETVFLFDMPGRFTSALYYLLPSIQVLYLLKYIDKFRIMNIIYLTILIFSFISSVIKFNNLRFSRYIIKSKT